MASRKTSYMRWTRGALIALVAHLCTPGGDAFAQGVAPCSPEVARLVSVQGQVDLRRNGTSEWQTVKQPKLSLCNGDSVHVGAQSRAALLIQPENIVRLDQFTTLSLSITPDETLVEFYEDDTAPSQARGQTCGAGYFISRFPRRFKVRTPFVNATVEGTEFLVENSCSQSKVAVFEGVVATQSNAGETTRATPGQVTTADASGQSTVKLDVRPVDAVQWSIHYPRLSDYDPTDSDTITLAESLISAGRVDEALPILDQIVGNPSADAIEAAALKSIVLLAKNDNDEALALARQAADAAPTSLRALLSLGYAEQARFDLNAAIDVTQRAMNAHPKSALAKARNAELLLATGRVNESLRRAEQAVTDDPNNGRARLARGFARLANLQTALAKKDFEAAIGLDSADPLSHLGAGLATIRGGDLIGGRERIETAVALDPTRALLRSYLGKAYFDERTPDRDKLAAQQFELAKSLDPKDPTPWYYDAIRKQTINQPGAALDDLQRSISLNENRAVYRSRLLLDQDEAARSASLARVYRDLGFDQLATSEALKSLNTEPRDFSAHRFLADAYAARPRQEIARVSELLQSQLRQPVNAAPLTAQQGEANLLLLDSGGPGALSFHEFNPLFMRDRNSFTLSGLVGNRGTLGDEITASWLRGNSALSFGQFYYDTNGYRSNNNLNQQIYRVFGQHDFSASTSVQAEVRTTNLDGGEIALTNAPQPFSENRRQSLDTQSVRLGMRHALSGNSDLIASFILQSREQSNIDSFVPVGSPFFRVDIDVRRKTNAGTLEVQYSHRWERVSLIGGVGSYQDRADVNNYFALTQTAFGIPIVPGSVTSTTPKARHGNGYLYLNGRISDKLRLLGGVSADSYEDTSRYSRSQINPKFGVIFEPLEGTVLRFAAFRGLKRALVGNQTIEPTQVGGFNQFSDDFNGTDFTRVGVGFDQRFAPSVFGGVELSTRSLRVPLFGDDPTAPGETRVRNWDERLHRAYLSWLANDQISAGAEYYFERQSRQRVEGVTEVVLPAAIETTYWPLSATYHHPQGFFARMRATHVDQKNSFPVNGAPDFVGSDRFWITDLTFGYRTRYPRLLITLQGLNLFDAKFRYQETSLLGDPRSPLFLPGRSVLLKLTLAF